ncbi:FAD-dependent oxidoreductase [Acidicapsa ligni]|uniref:FAD-dependent oxidoreductase n=1 Tax=Acidicapsa ligni TaxID=542300 RepID=UPI0021DF5960|nr:FAD-dependent oxidoreductase [Acidicapsa ligni]
MREFELYEAAKLKDGQRQIFNVGKTEMLVLRHHHKLIAIQSKCPHAGGPLEEGAICNGRIVCPWHMGTFNLPDGKLIEPPAMQSLDTYSIREGREGVFVSVPDAKKPVSMHATDKRKFLIVGCGAAGAMAAKTLRDEHFSGKILMVDPHSEEPIDRTMLTKMSLSGKEPVPKLKELNDLNLTRITASLVRLQSDRKMVTLSDGSRFKYDAALIATGGKPKQLPTKVTDKIHVIRHTEDLKSLRRAALPKSHAVIIGTSFIGMEAASALTQRGLKVTVIGEEELPFEKQFGCEISSALLSLHKRKGVKFVLGVKIIQLTNNRVLLQKGDKVVPIDADLVVLGVGVVPKLDFEHDLPLAADGSVLTDKSLRADGHVWVAGDIANVGGRRIEHWRVAQQHGMAAAKQMLGQRADVESVPFFWTYHFEKKINYLGHATEWEDISIVGDVDRLDFIAFMTTRGKVKAVVSCAKETETALLAELMRKPLSLSTANRAIRSIASRG